MAQEPEVKKTRGRKKGQVVESKLSDELKAVLAEAKKLNYADMQYLSTVITAALKGRKQKQIDELEAQLKKLKES